MPAGDPVAANSTWPSDRMRLISAVGMFGLPIGPLVDMGGGDGMVGDARSRPRKSAF